MNIPMNVHTLGMQIISLYVLGYICTRPNIWKGSSILKRVTFRTNSKQGIHVGTFDTPFPSLSCTLDTMYTHSLQVFWK